MHMRKCVAVVAVGIVWLYLGNRYGPNVTRTTSQRNHDINPLFLDACLTEHRPPPGHSIWQMGGIMHIM